MLTDLNDGLARNPDNVTALMTRAQIKDDRRDISGAIADYGAAIAIKPDDPHFARTRLLALENTLGGKVLPFAYLQQATRLAKAKGLAAHLDGARLFNAAVAQAAVTGSDARSEARRIASLFDSVAPSPRTTISRQPRRSMYELSWKPNCAAAASGDDNSAL